MQGFAGEIQILLLDYICNGTQTLELRLQIISY